MQTPAIRVDPTHMGPPGRSHRLRSCGAPRAGLSAQMRSEEALPFLRVYEGSAMRVRYCVPVKLCECVVPRVCVNESQSWKLAHAGLLSRGTPSAPERNRTDGSSPTWQKDSDGSWMLHTGQICGGTIIWAQSMTPGSPRFSCRFAAMLTAMTAGNKHDARDSVLFVAPGTRAD